MDVRRRKIASGAAFFGNFLASLSDEGRVFLSDGKDYANTTRVVTQKWVPLGDEELYIAASSAIYKCGEVKETVQFMYRETMRGRCRAACGIGAV